MLGGRSGVVGVVEEWKAARAVGGLAVGRAAEPVSGPMSSKTSETQLGAQTALKATTTTKRGVELRE